MPGALIALTWFGALLLIARSLDIYVDFNLLLTGIWHVPADRRADFLHLARWFMFGYGPWFVLGAVAWTRLAWRYTRRIDTRPAVGSESAAAAQPAFARGRDG